MIASRQTAPLSGGRKVAVLVMPWLFLAVIAAVYDVFLIPRVSSLSAAWLIVVGVFIGMVFLSFTVAAVTFSRDVLIGRYRG